MHVVLGVRKNTLHLMKSLMYLIYNCHIHIYACDYCYCYMAVVLTRLMCCLSCCQSQIKAGAVHCTRLCANLVKKTESLLSE